MIKKMFISLLFFVLHNSYIISMDLIESSDKTIDYIHFFDLCKNGHNDAIKDFIINHPTIDINFQNNHGTTPLLHTATWGNWNNVCEYLLENYNADKMLKDNYEQTLFSKAVYSWNSAFFKHLLKIYSFDEINLLCKTICLNRDQRNPAEFSFQKDNIIILDALNNKKDLNETNNDRHGQTILHIACRRKKIPFIIKLIESGVTLDIKDNLGNSCYDYLYSKIPPFERAPLFVIREVFNNGSCIPTALMSAVFINISEMNYDVANYIKQLYVELILQDKPFESPKVRIWKYVCKDACEKAGLINKDKEIDERRCLTIILLLSQHKLTEINIQLALENK